MDQAYLVATIKEWMDLDASIAQLRLQTRALNKRKSDVAGRLVSLMQERKLDEIAMTEAKIVRHTRRTKAPVNKKHLLSCLATYYKSDTTAKEVSDFILATRAEKSTDIICKR